MNDPFKSPSKPHVAPTPRVPTAELFAPTEVPKVTQDLTTLNQAEVQTMSSREIAELTGKRHNNVTADVTKMLTELGLGVLSFQHTYRDTQNKEQTEYILDQRLTFTLITGYSILLRDRVVQRWLELEKQERLHSHLTTEIYRELRYHAAVAERRSVRWVIEHKMVPWAQHKFRLISPAILDPILNSIKSFLTAYWPNESGEMRLLSKSKPAQSLIERNWTDREILQHHRFVHKHDPNPPETAEQMLIRLGDRPKAHLLESL